MELSKRLGKIASLVPKNSVVADIGTDHGYIPIDLTKKGTCPKAYAMDVNQGPLDKAIANVKREGLEDKVICILSDGLERLPKEGVDTVVIAGMGGDLMEQILIRGSSAIIHVQTLILSPQSHPEKVRHFLHDHGYAIEEEAMLKEDGKFYLVIKAQKGSQTFDQDWLYFFGKRLLEAKDQIMKEYLEQEFSGIEKILASFDGKNQASIQKRKIELEVEKRNILEALSYYEL